MLAAVRPDGRYAILLRRNDGATDAYVQSASHAGVGGLDQVRHNLRTGSSLYTGVTDKPELMLELIEAAQRWATIA